MRQARAGHDGRAERFSHDLELGSLYRELAALRQVDMRTCIAPEWVERRAKLVSRRVNRRVAALERDRWLDAGAVSGGRDDA